MVTLFHRRSQSFSLPLLPPVVIGLIVTVLFYLLILTGPLDYYLLRRYCLCHEVAIVTVGLFWISIVALSQKLIQVRKQTALLSRGVDSLRLLLDASRDGEGATASEQEQEEELIAGAAEEKEEIPQSRVQRARWLAMNWQSVSTDVWQGYFGQRLRSLLERQIQRGNTKGLDEDLRELGNLDADRHHDSFGMIRIAIWAMPMLGFLGTVIGIAGTLGQIDSEMLASGSQEAMNTITAGLYVAFDKTAIALALTMVTMFVQFAVQRVEHGLLIKIDERMSDTMIAFLTEEEQPNFVQPTQDILERLTAHLGQIVTNVVQQQAEIWKATIQEAHQHWERVSVQSETLLTQSLTNSIDAALEKHRRNLELSEAQGMAQIDSRWQQWQTTLSDQVRLLHSHQRELTDHSQLLHEILQKAGDLHQIEHSLDQNILRLTDVDRFHEAAICLTEAVAFLGTQMEKHGVLGKGSLRVSSEEDRLPKPRPRGRAA